MNIRLGFLHSHLGWLCTSTNDIVEENSARKKSNGNGKRSKSHAEILNEVDIIDLETDLLLQWQHKYYTLFGLLSAYVLPYVIASLWGEALVNILFLTEVSFMYY